jgi:hypothetical protein
MSDAELRGAILEQDEGAPSARHRADADAQSPARRSADRPRSALDHPLLRRIVRAMRHALALTALFAATAAQAADFKLVSAEQGDYPAIIAFEGISTLATPVISQKSSRPRT